MEAPCASLGSHQDVYLAAKLRQVKSFTSFLETQGTIPSGYEFYFAPLSLSNFAADLPRDLSPLFYEGAQFSQLFI